MDTLESERQRVIGKPAQIAWATGLHGETLYKHGVIRGVQPWITKDQFRYIIECDGEVIDVESHKVVVSL